MRGWFACVLLTAAVVAGEDLEGEITGGKARQLVDEALPMLEEADEIFRAWVLDQLPVQGRRERLERAVALYDAATNLLQQALDLRYDPGVNHRCRVAARRLPKLRFELYFRHRDASEPERPEPEHPEPEPAKPPRPREKEDPVAPAPKPHARAVEEPPQPAVAFAEGAPPAVPVDASLPTIDPPVGDKGYDALVKRDLRAITERVKEYYTARKPGKLTFRHRLCAGKGTLRDGSTCADCGGTGKLINLFWFRKVFWGSFTPLLRDTPGALPALRAFHAAAQRDPTRLGPEVKSFRIRGIEHKVWWARVTVEVKTDEGTTEEALTLVSAGTSWFFFHQKTDLDLALGKAW